MKSFCEKASRNYQLRLRPNQDVENTFRAYETSWETERLSSEQNRQIYCELIDLGRKEIPEKNSEILDIKSKQIATDKSTIDDDNEEQPQVVVVVDKAKWWTKFSVDTIRPKSLVEIAVESSAKAYKNGPVDERIWCQDAVDFGLHADIELPILDLLELQNETFWKRLVESRLGDVLKLQKLKRNSKTNWKRIGIELRFVEFIENLEQNDFESPAIIEKLNEMTNKFELFVENVSIKRMKPRIFFEKNQFNEKFHVVNFSSDECIHGSLEFLGGLKNLKNFSITFDCGWLTRSFKRRFYQVAISDIQNIGKALISLKKLESFKIHKSDLSESLKLSHLLTSMENLDNLKSLDLSYCSITLKRSGEAFEKFLSVNRSLEHLELKGNKFDSDFCFHLSRGIKSFAGKFKYLGVSMTPILNNGLGFIIKSIRESSNVCRFDFSNCENSLHGSSDECIEALISLIESQGSIREITMNENEIISKMTIENFVKALDINYKIDEVDCENCGFTSNELVKIKVLLLRNKYYKDNPILKKENFSYDDEAAIETFLKRTKHPLLIKYKKPIVHSPEVKKPLTFSSRNIPETIENYADFASSTVQGMPNYFN